MATKIQLNYYTNYNIESINIYIRGYIIVNESILTKNELSEHIYRLIKSGNLEESIKSFNGIFSIIIKEGDLITVINDRWGTFPLFYFNEDSLITIFDKWEDITNHTSKTFNKNAIFELIGFGYTLDDKTLINEVYEFPPHSYCKICKDRFTKTSYWHYELTDEYKEISETELEVKFANLWNKRLSIYTSHVKNNGNCYFMPISGGLDSRLLLNEFDKKGINSYSMTFGSNKCNTEIQASLEIIEKISNNLGHKIHLLNKTNFEYLYNSTVHPNKITSCHFSNIALNDFNNQSSFCNFYIPGYSGDFMAGSHIKYKMNLWKNKSDIVNYIKQSKSFKSLQILLNNKPESAETISNSITDSSNYINSFLRWDLENRQRRLILRLGIPEYKTDQIMLLPFFDNELMDFFAKLPQRLLINERLYVNTQLKYLYKNNEYLIKIKRDGKQQKLINNNLLYEYIPKIKNKLKSILKIKSSKNSRWSKDVIISDYIDFDLISDYISKDDIKHLQPEQITNLAILTKNLNTFIKDHGFRLH